jgi:hypothetical protein
MLARDRVAFRDGIDRSRRSWRGGGLKGVERDKSVSKASERRQRGMRIKQTVVFAGVALCIEMNGMRKGEERKLDEADGPPRERRSPGAQSNSAWRALAPTVISFLIQSCPDRPLKR